MVSVCHVATVDREKSLRTVFVDQESPDEAVDRDADKSGR